MDNVYGFSSQQLVLGYNSSAPGLDNESIKLSQLDEVATSKLVADH